MKQNTIWLHKPLLVVVLPDVGAGQEVAGWGGGDLLVLWSMK